MTRQPDVTYLEPVSRMPNAGTRVSVPYRRRYVAGDDDQQPQPVDRNYLFMGSVLVLLMIFATVATCSSTASKHAMVREANRHREAVIEAQRPSVVQETSPLFCFGKCK